jgi:hypothetical protein
MDALIYVVYVLLSFAVGIAFCMVWEWAWRKGLEWLMKGRVKQ